MNYKIHLVKQFKRIKPNIISDS